MSVSRSAGTYFAAQGITVIAWWGLLIFYPSSRAFFRMDENSDAVLLAFWLPDLALLAFGSLVGGWFCLRGNEHLSAVLWFVCGTVSYATLYCLAFAFMTDSGWLGVALMLPATLLSISATLAVTPLGVSFFRQARPARTSWNLLKTFSQIVVFWGMFLFVVPNLITLLEQRIGVPRFTFPLQQSSAFVFFACMSTLGLWSGFTMARRGGGTPLPLDAPRRLVVTGPYAYVRNPMAIAGLGQGVAVGLWFGSWLVLAYVIVGGWIWQALTRPLEEEDMSGLFGADYERYRREVRCWIPRPKQYRAAD